MVRQIQKPVLIYPQGKPCCKCDFHKHWALSTPPLLAADNFKSVSGESKAGAGP